MSGINSDPMPGLLVMIITENGERRNLKKFTREEKILTLISFVKLITNMASV